MLDLDALQILDTALPVNTDAVPANRLALHVVETSDVSPGCPHLAGLAAE